MAFVRLINTVSIWGGRLAALVVLPLIFSMGYEVFSRYGLSRPTLWAFEVSYMLMGSIFVLGMAYALAVGAHVNVDFIHNALPKRVIAVIDFLCFAVLTGLAGWLTWQLALYAHAAYLSGEGSGLSAWNPKVWPYRCVLAAGFALLTLQAFAKTIENLITTFGVGKGAT